MVISLERWKGKVAIVTGASAGIGAAIVEQLVEAGLKIVGFARRQERLEELAEKLQHRNGKLYAFKVDITREDDVLKAFKWVRDNVGPVSILVNNAGITRYTTLIDGDSSMWRDILETNVFGLCVATKEAIKDMRANNMDGHIIHINSVFGHKVGSYPNVNVYPASKHAVTALTETLRQELNAIGSKIKITSISPGLVATEIFEATAVGSGKTELLNNMEEQLKEFPILQSDDVADAVSFVLATPPHVQIHEVTIKPVGESF